MKILLCLLILNILLAHAHKIQDCPRRHEDELIWEYDVRRSYMIGAYQEVEAEYGPTSATITCIGIDSLSDEDNGAVWVTSGGIGYNYVKIKFRSKHSRGLRYRVFVYGLPTVQRNLSSLHTTFI